MKQSYHPRNILILNTYSDWPLNSTIKIYVIIGVYMKISHIIIGPCENIMLLRRDWRIELHYQNV